MIAKTVQMSAISWYQAVVHRAGISFGARNRVQKDSGGGDELERPLFCRDRVNWEESQGRMYPGVDVRIVKGLQQRCIWANPPGIRANIVEKQDLFGPVLSQNALDSRQGSRSRRRGLDSSGTSTSGVVGSRHGDGGRRKKDRKRKTIEFGIKCDGLGDAGPPRTTSTTQC